MMNAKPPVLLLLLFVAENFLPSMFQLNLIKNALVHLTIVISIAIFSMT